MVIFYAFPRNCALIMFKIALTFTAILPWVWMGPVDILVKKSYLCMEFDVRGTPDRFNRHIINEIIQIIPLKTGLPVFHFPQGSTTPIRIVN